MYKSEVPMAHFWSQNITKLLNKVLKLGEGNKNNLRKYLNSIQCSWL